MVKRVLAGMRPSNALHIGNYLGAAKGMIALQDGPDYETFYMVADLHAITTPYDNSKLSEAVQNVVLDYLAAGLNPEKSTIFIQSHVPEHTELAYLLSTSMTVARMQHLPTFKEKVKQFPDNVTMALLNYPVLMSADILLYKAELVPVGIDQEPHLEIAREIARKMNNEYSTDFPEPKRFATQGEYVPSLTGEGKMSKSVPGSYIALTDDLETIKKRLAATPTDSGSGEIKIDKNDNKKYIDKSGSESPGVATLMTLVELFEAEDKRSEYEDAYQSTGIRYKDLKEKLSEAIYEEIKPTQERRKELERDKDYIDKILKEGAGKAREVAKQNILEVKEKMGLG